MHCVDTIFSIEMLVLTTVLKNKNRNSDSEKNDKQKKIKMIIFNIQQKK